jgi:predicted secreted protein with PEFG-CTERM motif
LVLLFFVKDAKGDTLSYAVVFVTSRDACNDMNTQALHFYESVTDQYLTKYGIPHQEKNSLCVTMDGLNSHLTDLQGYDLPIIVLDQNSGLNTLFIKQNAWGEWEWNNGNQVIVTCACSSYVESASGAWTLSHELSHFSLYHKQYSYPIYVSWVHWIQNQTDNCQNNDPSLSSCPNLWTTVKSPAGNTIQVMETYDGSNPPAQPQSASVTSTVSITTDKRSYNYNDVIDFLGTVNPVISNELIRINVKDPSNNLVYQTVSFPNTAGHYSQLILSGGSTWKNSGLYTVEAQYGSSSSTNTFIFNASPPQVQNYGSSNMHVTQQNQYHMITVLTNKAYYNTNDPIVISGSVNVNQGIPQPYVTVAITDSNGKVVYQNYADLDPSGRFTNTIDPIWNFEHIAGVFVLTASYDGETAKSSFTLGNTIPEFGVLSSLVVVISISGIIVMSKRSKFHF